MLAHFIDSKAFQCGYFKDRESLFEEYLLEDISEIEFEYLNYLIIGLASLTVSHILLVNFTKN